jgi:hypothetical protein
MKGIPIGIFAVVAFRFPRGLVWIVTSSSLTRSKVERYFVEHSFVFLVHYSISEESTLCVDPSAQLRIFVLPWHVSCMSGRKTVYSVSGDSQDDEGKNGQQPQTTHNDHDFL